MSLIQLSTESNPLTASIPVDLSQAPAERAIKRFSITGNAIVTGGTGGLGIEVVRARLEHGAKGICIFDLAPGFEAARKDLQALYDAFPEVKFVEEIVDVSDESSVQKALQNTAEKLGSVDNLLCFAGIGRTESAEMSLKTWDDVIGVNLTGSWLSAKHAAQQMIKQGTGGSIVLIASIAGHNALYPIPGSAYGVSKSGILGLTRNLAGEWARYGIRVNSLSPGFINTKMVATPGASAGKAGFAERNPMGRIGQPSELTEPIVMLCSPAGRYITGTDIIVDGGAHVF